MLVSPLLYHALVYGGLALAAVGLLVLAVRVERVARRTGLPEAAVVRRGGAAGLRRFAPSLMIVLGLGASAWIWLHSRSVLIVEDSAVGSTTDGGAPAATRYVWIGTPPYHATNIGGMFRDPTWVVNDSTRTIRLQRIGYDQATYPPEDIAPQAAAAVDAVDYVGPDDEPPYYLDVKESLSGLPPSAHRTWVTWDR